MQTFLPYPDLARSAAVLDRQRLGKQRVEALQILNALSDSNGWANHPAVRMWRGYEAGLVRYGVVICDEWISRGYQDTCRDKIIALVAADRSPRLPPWFGDEDFHRSHRSNLLRKNPRYYTPFFEDDLPDDLPYIWPVTPS